MDRYFKNIEQFTRAVYQCDMPLPSLDKWILQNESEMGLNLTPAFQRGPVWSREQQSAYLEYILRGGVTARDLHFNCPNWNHGCIQSDGYSDFVCVDGLQRITAIRAFFKDEVPVFGAVYSEYKDPKALNFNCVRLHVNELPTEADVLRWYLELNDTGVHHTDEELNRVREMLQRV
jgi:hypothetical protein